MKQKIFDVLKSLQFIFNRKSKITILLIIIKYQIINVK